MVQNFNFEMLMGMGGGDVPESAKKALNKQLTQFDCVE